MLIYQSTNDLIYDILPSQPVPFPLDPTWRIQLPLQTPYRTTTLSTSKTTIRVIYVLPITISILQTIKDNFRSLTIESKQSRSPENKFRVMKANFASSTTLSLLVDP